jgi:hypothetical protein
MNLVRDGAQRMLAAALEAEVAAYIERHAHELDENGHRLVVRNGFRCEREVLTGAGAVPVVAPRVNDKRVDPVTGERQRFSSTILPVWARKSPKVAEVLPLLYLHGLSSLDFAPGLDNFSRRSTARLVFHNCGTHVSLHAPIRGLTIPICLRQLPAGAASACPLRADDSNDAGALKSSEWPKPGGDDASEPWQAPATDHPALGVNYTVDRSPGTPTASR